MKKVDITVEFFNILAKNHAKLSEIAKKCPPNFRTFSVPDNLSNLHEFFLLTYIYRNSHIFIIIVGDRMRSKIRMAAVGKCV